MITDRLIYSYYDDKKKLWIPPVIEKLVSLESQAPSATFEEPLNVYKYGAWLLSDGVLNELYSVIPEHDSLNHESIKYDIRESRTTIYDRFIIEKVKYTIKNEQIPKVIIELNVRPLFPDAVKITGRFIPYKSLSGYDYYPERVAINVIIPKEKFKSFKVSEKLADLLGANLYNISNIKWFVYNSVSLTKQHVVITLGFSHDRDLSGW